MESVCGNLVDNRQLQGNCVVNALGNQPTICSNYFSNVDGMGSECISWLNANRGIDANIPKTVDNIIKDHCNKYPWLDECQCEKRFEVPVYKETLEKVHIDENSYPAVCWFKPCNRDQADNTMITDRMLNSSTYCPSKMCINIQNQRQNYTSQGEFDQYINCGTYIGTGEGEEDKSPSSSTNTGIPNSSSSSGSNGNNVGAAGVDAVSSASGFFSKNAHYLIGGAVIMIVLLVGFFLMMSRGEVSTSTKATTRTQASTLPSVPPSFAHRPAPSVEGFQTKQQLKK
jgi:hypothetical protein